MMMMGASKRQELGLEEEDSHVLPMTITHTGAIVQVTNSYGFVLSSFLLTIYR
uniref:Uncharacterized protein n=2 Tax=Picea TaxID=3328 RepID=A0A117NGS3_PICGL|nr:hypothetical protein ABT39_MTgene5426 [Picea glauca]QHR91485.1 hypothetical protein Q903MT_gene5520 [Picea sitchensis]